MQKMITRIFAIAIMLLGAFNVSNAQQLFYEDFADGLTGWTQQDLSDIQSGDAWIHSTTGPAGSFAIDPIASTTAADGFALFDSDLMCSYSQNALLISPTIDCASATQVFVKFQQFYRRYHDSTYVLISVDNGASWADTIQVNGDLEDNDLTAANPDKIQFDISALAAGQSQVKIAFQFSSDDSGVASAQGAGCGYSWQIDDIELTSQGVQNDLLLSQIFNPASAYAQPVSQIKADTFGFFALITNKGAAPQTNVVLKASVYEVDLANQTLGAQLFADSIIIPEIVVGVADSDWALVNQFVPDLPVGTYATVYELYSKDSQDENPSDNSDLWVFEVSENLFSRDNGNGLQGYTLGNVASYPGGWYTGCYYRMSPDITEAYVATTAQTITVPNTGATSPTSLPVDMDILLMKVNDDVDAAFDNFDNTTLQGSLTTIGFATVNVPVGYQNTELDGALSDFNSGTPNVPLVAGGRYFLVMAYTDENKKTMFHAFQDDAENLDYPFQAPTSLIFASNPDDPNNVDAPQNWYLNGFGTDISSVMRMTIQLVSKTDEVPLADNAINAFPNPTTDLLNVDIDLAEAANATVTLADLNGKVMTYQTFKNVTKTTAQFNVRNYPAGTYLVRIATKEGSKTKQFVVVH